MCCSGELAGSGREEERQVMEVKPFNNSIQYLYLGFSFWQWT